MSEARAPGPTQAAVFEDIGSVARQERHRLFGPEPEAPAAAEARQRGEAEAAGMLARARRDAAAFGQKAREDGYRDGHAEGYAIGRGEGQRAFDAERAAMRADVEALTARIAEERARIWRDCEEDVIRLVLEIARKVVKDDAEVNRGIALSTIRNALRRVVATDEVRIRVNVLDLETVRSSRADLMEMLDGVRHLELVEDRRVSPGGCVVETANGAIDARIDTQVGEIETALLGMAREAR
ncbi:MAG: hypothetical protein IT208_07850 [Chthonomonadales bacterium]|nr:hypothetical protein [Chthonomonadales bacterium]